MEYSFRLSELFPEEITVIGNDLIPVGCPLLNQLGAKVVKERVSEIMDTMGRASAEAQSLHSIITNAEKLRQGDNKLYMFCDFVSNKAVGLLKIGRKKLFLFDDSGTQHELGPMCILDFYIHETRQRQGAGKFLFDHMLREENIPVEHFAIDRPSDKLIFFLRKHYGCKKVLPQVNNFVLFDGFFNNRSDYIGKKARWTGLDQSPEVHHVAHAKDKVSRMEDSLSYNCEPLIHLRNGHQLPPNYTQRRHNTTIGDILQPTHQQLGQGNENWHHGNGTAANGNGNGHYISLNSNKRVNEKVDGGGLDPSNLKLDDQPLPVTKNHRRYKRSSVSSVSPLTSIPSTPDWDVETHVDRVLNVNTDLRKIRGRSSSRDLDQNHEPLW